MCFIMKCSGGFCYRHTQGIMPSVHHSSIASAITQQQRDRFQLCPREGVSCSRAPWQHASPLSRVGSTAIRVSPKCGRCCSAAAPPRRRRGRHPLGFTSPSYSSSSSSFYPSSACHPLLRPAPSVPSAMQHGILFMNAAQATTSTFAPYLASIFSNNSASLQSTPPTTIPPTELGGPPTTRPTSASTFGRFSGPCAV